MRLGLVLRCWLGLLGLHQSVGHQGHTRKTLQPNSIQQQPTTTTATTATNINNSKQQQPTSATATNNNQQQHKRKLAI